MEYVSRLQSLDRLHSILGLQIVGASLSKPHIDEFTVIFLIYIYICCTLCCKSLAAHILYVIASFVNQQASKM